MSKGKVFITDYGFADLRQESDILTALGYEVYSAKSTTEEEIIVKASDADALLVQWAPVTAKVIANLRKCRVIVRYGIGVDNIDLEAAKQKSIPVCNVPDYCVHEVADHTLSLALALARQLTETNSRMKQGIWKIIPPHPMPAFRDMIFATIGYGRIAREVLKRSDSFGFMVAAYDPNITDKQMRDEGVQPFTLEELLTKSDIISLHLPLNEETRHMINSITINKMKNGAILINTSRGGLIDTAALTLALGHRRILVGLDVYETEPLTDSHPLWNFEHALLTSHIAWYSERSVPKLQQMAAEEVVRGLQGENLRNRVF